MNKYPRPRKVVEVEWIDSTFTSGWRETSEYERIPMGPLTSTGYLLSKDKHSIRLVQSMSAPAECVAGVIAIPMGCVTNIRTVRK